MRRCINCFAMAILKFKMAAMSDLISSPAGRDRKYVVRIDSLSG